MIRNPSAALLPLRRMERRSPGFMTRDLDRQGDVSGTGRQRHTLPRTCVARPPHGGANRSRRTHCTAGTAMTLSALEGALGGLFRAPHPPPRLQGGTLCCEGVFVHRVGHLPHGLAYNLFGFCLGFLSGTHLSTSTLTVRVPLSPGENPEQAVSRLHTAARDDRRHQRRSRCTQALLSYAVPGPRQPPPRPRRSAAPPLVPSADCRRASPDTPRGERTPRATNPPEAQILAIGRGGLAHRAVSPRATCCRSCTSRVSSTRSCRFATSRPTAFSRTSPPGPGSRHRDPWWCRSAPSAGASCRPWHCQLVVAKRPDRLLSCLEGPIRRSRLRRPHATCESRTGCWEELDHAHRTASVGLVERTDSPSSCGHGHRGFVPSALAIRVGHAEAFAGLG